MKIITGQVARKDSFWNRKEEIKNIWYKLENKEHILLVAPRRVGKTSIMYNLLDNPKDDYIFLYIDTEAANNTQEFWKKLFYRLCEEEFINTLENKAKNLFNKLKTINISEISLKGIKLEQSSKIDYLEVLKDILKEFDVNKRLVIMLDEFAQTIENIIKYENEEEAKKLLSIHREIRQDKEISKHLSFIYAGSIGLESMASKINSISLINDLAPIKIKPLKSQDAKDFIKKLASSNNINIDEENVDYILKKIQWLIPFYIQLILDYLRNEEDKITKENIDEAFSSILENRNHFEHWHSRLKSFKDNEYKFLKEILNIISENKTIKSNEIYNQATKYKIDEEVAKELLHSLKYDGYINNNEDSKIYKFNSPILAMWWEQNVAN